MLVVGNVDVCSDGIGTIGSSVVSVGVGSVGVGSVGSVGVGVGVGCCLV